MRLRFFGRKIPADSTDGKLGNNADRLEYVGPKRFLSDGGKRYQDYVHAAQAYVHNSGDETALWLFAKPFDRSPGNAYLYNALYNVLNLLGVMQLPLGARILE